MTNQERFPSRILNNPETRWLAAGAIAVTTTVITGNSVDVISEHKDKLADTTICISALGITYALMARTLESAYSRHKHVGWISFTGTAAFVADHIYNLWS